MPSIRIAFALASALVLSACLPVATKTPLGTTAGFKPDAALNGMWRGQNSDNGETGYMGFIKNDDDTMTAVLVSPEQDKAGDWETFSLKVTTLGGKHYMTARETFAKDQPAPPQDASGELGNIIVLYRIEGKTLRLYFADEKKTAALIKAGKLHGTVSDDTSSPDITLTSNAAELDKFFASSAADALFVEPTLTLTKMP